MSVSVHDILKWVVLLCVASIIINGLRYWMTGDSMTLISLFGSMGIGILSGVGMLRTRNK